MFGNNAAETGIPADIWRFYLLFVRPESQVHIQSLAIESVIGNVSQFFCIFKTFSGFIYFSVFIYFWLNSVLSVVWF